MSKATVTHDVVATNGEYTDRQTGEVKKRYLNVGKVFTSDDGRMSIKLDSIPVGPTWSGWLSLYPVQRDGQQQPRRASSQDQMPPGRQQQRTMPPAPAVEAAPWEDDSGDDIPF